MAKLAVCAGAAGRVVDAAPGFRAAPIVSQHAVWPAAQRLIDALSRVAANAPEGSAESPPASQRRTPLVPAARRYTCSYDSPNAGTLQSRQSPPYKSAAARPRGCG